MEFRFQKVNINPLWYTGLGTVLGLFLHKLGFLIGVLPFFETAYGFLVYTLILIFILNLFLTQWGKYFTVMYIGNGVLVYRSLGFEIFALSVKDIIAIDSAQGWAMPSFAPSKAYVKREKRVGFSIQTQNSYFLVKDELIDYEAFLQSLKAVNNQILLGYITKRRSEDLLKMTIEDYAKKYQPKNAFILWFSRLNVVIAGIFVLSGIVGGMFLLMWIIYG